MGFCVADWQQSNFFFAGVTLLSVWGENPMLKSMGPISRAQKNGAKAPGGGEDNGTSIILADRRLHHR